MSTLDSLRGVPYSAASGCAEMVGRQSIHTQGEVMLLAEMYDVQQAISSQLSCSPTSRGEECDHKRSKWLRG